MAEGMLQVNIKILNAFLLLILLVALSNVILSREIGHHSIKELVHEEYYNLRGRDEGNGIRFVISRGPSQTSTHRFVKKATFQKSALSF